jgi:hypothetical protein
MTFSKDAHVSRITLALELLQADVGSSELGVNAATS